MEPIPHFKCLIAFITELKHQWCIKITKATKKFPVPDTDSSPEHTTISNARTWTSCVKTTSNAAIYLYGKSSKNDVLKIKLFNGPFLCLIYINTYSN